MYYDRFLFLFLPIHICYLPPDYSLFSLFLPTLFFNGQQYALVTFGGNFTQTCPLTLREWATTTLLGAVALPVGVLMRFMPKPFDNDEDDNSSDGASSGTGSGSSLLTREGMHGIIAAGEISGTYEAFPTAAAALSSSAGNFKHVMSSEQRLKKVRTKEHRRVLLMFRVC